MQEYTPDKFFYDLLMLSIVEQAGLQSRADKISVKRAKRLPIEEVQAVFHPFREAHINPGRSSG